MIYDPDYRLRSVGRPITLDAVACDFPELKLAGVHVGIPWADEMIAMGQDKVPFGTDFPVLDFERTRAEIEALGLRPEAQKKLLRDNAIRVYKLKRYSTGKGKRT